MPKVKTGVLWRISACTVLMSAPAAISLVPKVWRGACRSNTRPAASFFGIPALSMSS